MENEYGEAIRRLLAEQLQLSTVKANDPNLTALLLQMIGDSPVFQRAAEILAQRMVTGVAVSNARSWREAARQATQGRRIYDLLQAELAKGAGGRVAAIVRENASLIRHVPLQMAQRATELASTSAQQGLRPASIMQHLRRVLPEMAETRIRLIARTEVAKANTAITQARAERMDLPAYRWATSKDGRVRTSHRLMDGVIVFWDEAPSPEQLADERSTLGHYHAGAAPNCRCIPLPLVNLDSIHWPARVYYNGSLVSMRRSQFTALRVRVAA